METPPVFLPGKSHGQRRLAGYSLGVTRVDLATKPPPPSKSVKVKNITILKKIALVTLII